MDKHLYLKLAINNIRQNRKFYLPYMVAASGIVLTFYIMNFLSGFKGLETLKGAGQVVFTMYLGTFVIGLVSIIFLFYINSFLMKRRKKEIGLYSVLGMEKKHIGRVLAIEKIVVSISILIAGIGTGIIFSKLLFLILLKLIKMGPDFAYEFTFNGVINTGIFFGVLFLAIIIYDVLSVRMNNPIELLKGGNVGEKEPKAKILMTLLGIITMGTGYYIAITTKDPISAIILFFIAVVLVIIGTYLLFTSVSIFILKLLKKNKNFYYKPGNFTAISGMLYRMKQNAVGLANICILSTMVLVMVSTTVSLYIGTEDMLKTRVEGDVNIMINDTDIDEVGNIEDAVNDYLKDEKIKYSNLKVIQSIDCVLSEKNGEYITEWSTFDNMNSIIFEKEELYQSITKEVVDLKDGEYLAYAHGLNKNKIMPEEFNIKGIDFKFTKKGDVKKFITPGNEEANVTGYTLMVVNEKTANELLKCGSGNINISFDVNEDAEGEVEISEALVEKLSSGIIKFEYINEITRGYLEDFYYQFIGGFLFLGILLGTVFTCMAAVVIYYKQITEGFYDKDKFQIMQKVGMSNSEVKATIRKQVVMVFFLPLIVAGIHTFGAFPLVSKLLCLFGLSNTNLFAICTLITLGVFSLIYGAVYLITAREYYKIVSWEK